MSDGHRSGRSTGRVSCKSTIYYYYYYYTGKGGKGRRPPKSSDVSNTPAETTEDSTMDPKTSEEDKPTPSSQQQSTSPKSSPRAGLQMEEEANKFLPCRPRFHQQRVPHLQTSSKADHLQPVKGNHKLCPENVRLHFSWINRSKFSRFLVFIVFNRQNSDERWRVYNIFNTP